MADILLDEKPLVETSFSPEDIIGSKNIKVFTEHCTVVFGDRTGDYPEKQLSKKIGATDRANIAYALEKLREHGYYPLGISDTGSIIWGVATKSKSQILFESGLGEYLKMSTADLQKIGRSMYNPLISKVTVDKAKDYDINHLEVIKR